MLAVVDVEAEVPEWVDYSELLSSFEVVLDSRMALRCVAGAKSSGFAGFFGLEIMKIN